MSVEKAVEASEILYSFPQIEPKSNTNNTLIFEEISRELDELLLRENDSTDSTGGVFEFLAEISNQVQKEFNELLVEDTDKKRFLKSLSKILALLLNTKLILPKKFKKSSKLHLKLPSKYDQDKSNSKKIG